MQLSLLDQFEKSSTRQLKLVESLISLIKLFKYYRTCTRFAHMNEANIKMLSSILDTMVVLTYHSSIGLEFYKNKDLKYFKDISEEKVHLGMVDVPSKEDIQQYYINGSIRVRGLLRSNIDLLKDNLSKSNLLLSLLDKLCSLT